MTLYHIVPAVPFAYCSYFGIFTLFAFTTATKRLTFYVPFSASAPFGPAQYWQYHWCYANIRCFIPILEWIWFGDCWSWGLQPHRTLQISSLYVFLYC